MTTNATARTVRDLDADRARQVTIAHVLLTNANYDLEQVDRLLHGDEPDVRAIRELLAEAWRLTLIVEEELEDLENGRKVAWTGPAPSG